MNTQLYKAGKFIIDDIAYETMDEDTVYFHVANAAENENIEPDGMLEVVKALHIYCNTR